MILQFKPKKLSARTQTGVPLCFGDSEFRNILAGFLRSKKLSLETAFQILEGAESHMKEREFAVASHQILNLVLSSACSVYDCEFVALAENIRIPLVTTDRQILRDFPAIAVPLEKFIT